MRKVSITIPSIYPHKLKQTLESIQRYTKDIDYEVIVVGPEELRPVIEGKADVGFILDLELRGATSAAQKALEESEGEYSVWLTDDASATENWLYSMLNFLEENDNGRPLCGSFRMRLPSGKELRQENEILFNKIPYAMLGCMRTSTLKRLGGWDRGYRHYCADPDLGLRILNAGGRVIVCPDAWVILSVEDHDEKKKKRFAEDDHLFYKTWRFTLWKLKLQEIKKWRYWTRFLFVKDVAIATKILLRMLSGGDIGRLLKILSGLLGR